MERSVYVNIETWHASIPGLNPDFSRRIFICMPDMYTEEEESLPVMYMFDGQNLFYDEDAAYGHSWELASFVEQYNPGCILVGIESSPFGNERLCEYSPFTHHTPDLGLIRGVANTTLNWLIHELKPQIDARFNTFSDRENTYLGGSSMGGLISLYGVAARNDVFSRAACLSPSLWVHPEKSRRMLKVAGILPHTRVYMDYGSEEMSNHAATFGALLDCTRILLEKDVDLTFRIDPYGDHSESSWASRVPVMMQCLGLI